MNIVILTESKPQGVPGGSLIGGEWNLRQLNSISPQANWCSLDTDGYFTLKNGRYLITAHSIAIGVDSHKLRVRNIENDLTYSGLNCLAYSLQPNNSSTAHLIANVNISSQRVSFALEHFCKRSVANLGKGFPVNNGDDEVYSTVSIQRL